MSLSQIALPASLVSSYSLSQVISSSQANLPMSCSLTNNTLLLNSNCELELDSSTVGDFYTQPEEQASIDALADCEDPSLELVVFSSITMKQLFGLTSTAAIEVTAINAINNRNDLTSYRFQVRCHNPDESRKKIAKYSQQHGIELALIENAPKLEEPGLLVMDMDSTTIEIECIDEIAALAGVGKQVAEVTELAMQGELDFAQSLHQRVATLKGAPETILKQVTDNIPLMSGLIPLIEQLKTHGWRVAVASGGFTYFADHLKELLKLDATRANTLEIIEGYLTGKVLGEVVDAQVKADTLQALQHEYSLPAEQTVAMGDGANDLIMMNAASLGVAFHAKPIVTAQASCAINHQGLDVLIHWLK